MIYEFRTYDLKPGSVPVFGERVKEKLDKRLEYSQLGGYFYTEIGLLNQVIHIWPYKDLQERTQIRAQTVEDGIWPPDGTGIVERLNSEIMIPAKFMDDLTPQKIGPIFEMRTYMFAQGDLPKALIAWEKSIEERKKYSPFVGCWYSEIGQLNKMIHIWAYSSLDHRSETRRTVVEKGVWPPKDRTPLVSQESKILLPFEFSPLQ
tara:strand:+ start:501 stop:1115 length:615 start_codon:yes stop_codon:yes gene_type:complete